MNRDKSIDRTMKPQRRDPKRPRSNVGGGGSGTGDHHSPVLGLCRFLIVVIVSLDSADQVPCTFKH
ncbi:hypothetical protein HKD37_13G036188 [Glycine soja]